VSNSFACTVPDANLMIANVYTSIYNKIDIVIGDYISSGLEATSLALAQRYTCDHAIKFLRSRVPQFFITIYYVHQLRL
jgi:hypothetical protein